MRSATKKALGKSQDYLNFIRTLPCAVCPVGGQVSRTEAAHVGERGMSVKCQDTEAIPLCCECHREGPNAHHKAGKRFWDIHSLDRDQLIEKYNLMFQEQLCQQR